MRIVIGFLLGVALGLLVDRGIVHVVRRIRTVPRIEANR